MTNQPLTDKDLAAIAERCHMATPGPWEWCSETDSSVGYIDPSDVYPDNDNGNTWLRRAGSFEEGDQVLPRGGSLALPRVGDADFLVHASSDVSRLLREVVRLRAEVSLLRSRLEGNR